MIHGISKLETAGILFQSDLLYFYCSTDMEKVTKGNCIEGIAAGELSILIRQREEQHENNPENIPSSLSGGVIQISCGYRHTLFLMNDGKIFATGWNKYGQCGSFAKETLNSTGESYYHRLVEVILSNKNILQVAAGFSTGYAGNQNL